MSRRDHVRHTLCLLGAGPTDWEALEPQCRDQVAQVENELLTGGLSAQMSRIWGVAALNSMIGSPISATGDRWHLPAPPEQALGRYHPPFEVVPLASSRVDTFTLLRPGTALIGVPSWPQRAVDITARPSAIADGPPRNRDVWPCRQGSRYVIPYYIRGLGDSALCTTVYSVWGRAVPAVQYYAATHPVVAPTMAGDLIGSGDVLRFIAVTNAATPSYITLDEATSISGLSIGRPGGTSQLDSRGRVTAATTSDGSYPTATDSGGPQLDRVTVQSRLRHLATRGDRHVRPHAAALYDSDRAPATCTQRRSRGGASTHSQTSSTRARRQPTAMMREMLIHESVARSHETRQRTQTARPQRQSRVRGTGALHTHTHRR